MDFRLKGRALVVDEAHNLSFNPCSNGLSAQRDILAGRGVVTRCVSILVLMDFRLKVRAVLE